MELIYTLKGLDCPNCAAKIEQETAALEEISAASVNLMRQTLTVQTEHPHETVMELIEHIVHRHEPDVEVLPGEQHSHAAHAHSHHDDDCCHGHAHDHAHEHEHEHEHEHAHNHEHGDSMLLRLIAGGVIFAVGAVLHYVLHAPAPAVFAVMLAAYAVLGWDVVWAALRNLTRGKFFDEHFLMSIATVGAFVLGEYPEAAAVMLFYQIGEYLQSLAVQRSRRSISALLDIRPDTANLLHDGAVTEIPAEEAAVGDLILVKAGERIPLDGIVTDGTSMLDTSALTGESVPRRAECGDEVLSGCINQSGTLTVRVTKPFAESTATKVIEMVENAAARKAPAENFITVFARYYTPVVVGTAALLALIPPLLLHGAWSDWVHRAFVFLIVSCPCALVISVPLTFFGGIGAASKHGVLVKGSNYLEALGKVKHMVFDKTGTLTEGKFTVQKLLPAENVSEEVLLRAAALCECNSNHPIAASIMAAYGGTDAALAVSDTEEISGKGISVHAEEKHLLAGNAALMEEYHIGFVPCTDAGTKVYAAADGRYLGCILIADALKPDAEKAVAALREAGIASLTMLTGDDRAIAENIAAKLKLDGCHAELLPAQKVEQLETLAAALPAGEKLAFIGDGINDAPVLARADVGVAMGALGSDAAIEAADVVLMTDEPLRLADAVQIARETRRIVTQNIVFALGVKAILLILGACGIAGMWAAVFGDVGVTVLAVLNAMRMLRK